MKPMRVVVPRGARWVWCLVATSLVLAGCSSNAQTELDPAPSEERTSEASTADSNRSVDTMARITVSVTGAETFTWQGEQVVRLLRQRTDQEAINVLSVGMLYPQPLSEDPRVRFRWAFDLLKGYEDRPGDYPLEVRKEDEVGSNVIFIVLRVKDAAKEKLSIQDWDDVEILREFNVVKQPCVVTVGEGEQSGAIDCPAVADAEGATISFRGTWELTDDQA